MIHCASGRKLSPQSLPKLSIGLFRIRFASITSLETSYRTELANVIDVIRLKFNLIEKFAPFPHMRLNTGDTQTLLNHSHFSENIHYHILYNSLIWNRATNRSMNLSVLRRLSVSFEIQHFCSRRCIPSFLLQNGVAFQDKDHTWYHFLLVIFIDHIYVAPLFSSIQSGTIWYTRIWTLVFFAFS